MNVIEHLLQQVNVSTTHSVLSEHGNSWSHTFSCNNGFKIYSIISGHCYIQVEGSDRWSPLESGDVVVVLAARSHTLIHHPVGVEGHACHTNIMCLDVQIARDDVVLLFHPIPNTVTLRETFFETLTHENESEYLVRILATLTKSRPDLTGLLRAWCDETFGTYVQQLWYTDQNNTERLPNKTLESLIGMNTLDFKARLRLRKSRELLNNTDLEIREISQQLGFPNDETFIRDFYDRYGLSPMIYRVKKTLPASGAQSHH
ncbi:MAG: AraC family transcriptional regulator [Xanthomonadaceae bacterium]|nr:AraC family transcriptional regulator [Xanthomonadaceae bacterium]